LIEFQQPQSYLGNRNSFIQTRVQWEPSGQIATTQIKFGPTGTNSFKFG